ncbi:rhomboid-like protease 4 [Filimonas sp.]|nr:rhomboid-like protease 4 [Filimonas sp.]
MFLPIGDTNIEKGSFPFFTYLLIAANVAMFFFQVTMPPTLQKDFVYTYGCIPAEITNGLDLRTLFTSMFLHGGWWHLIGNMMFLWIFADNIEATIGSFKFIMFYIGGGVVAALTHSILNAGSIMPCVGASGAIAACLGAYIVMFPKSKVRVLFLLFLTSFSVPAVYFLGFWIVNQFMSGIGILGAATSDTDGVAYWAHIGGFVFGIVFGFMYRGHAKQMEIEDEF